MELGNNIEKKPAKTMPKTEKMCILYIYRY